MLPKTIVAFGGSTLFGMVDPEHGGYIGRLKMWHETQDMHNKVYNLGISGDTSTGMLKRLLPEAQPRKPDLILINLGLNDTRRLGSKTNPNITPLEQFTTNVHALITQAKSLAGVVVISACPIDEARTTPLTFWNPEYYYLLEDAKLYTQTVQEICEKNHIPYLDIFISPDEIPSLTSCCLRSLKYFAEYLYLYVVTICCYIRKDDVTMLAKRRRNN